MIITINTKEDSKDEIKRAIQMLMRLVEHHNEVQNDFNPILPGMNTTNNSYNPSTDSSSSMQGGIFGLFDNPSTQASSPTTQEQKEPEDKIEIWDY